MKKSRLILTLAASLLLTSCGNDAQIGSSLSSNGDSLEDVSISASNEVAIKGDYARTYLTNALETSFSKRGFIADITGFKSSTATREYTIGEPLGNEAPATKTNNTERVEIESPKVTYSNTNRHEKTHDKLNGYLGMKDATVTASKNGGPEEKQLHQYANVYLKDNKYYFDNLNDQGQPTSALDGEIQDLFDRFLEAVEYDGDPITLENKCYVELKDLDLLNKLNSTMPRTNYNKVASTLIDSWLDQLAGLDGVELIYEGRKIDGEKYYTTTINVTEAMSVYQSIFNMADQLPDVVIDAMGDDYSKEDLMDSINELMPVFDEASDFSMSLTFDYTPTVLKSIDYRLDYKKKERTKYELKEDETAPETVTDIEELSLLGKAAFTFDNNYQITFPDFSSYVEIVVPQKTA